MAKHYRVREFAELSGVTVRALHHYDQLGLLKPSRSASGYRVYGDGDFAIVEQIVALKFLGIPLKQIGSVLKRPPLDWRNTLRLQREALEDRQRQIERAIRVIRTAESAIPPDGVADPAAIKTLIEVIDMENGVSVMKKYYSEEAWEKHRRYYEEGPSEEWLQFYEGAKALLGSDPSSPEAQALVARWNDLSRRAHEGDPGALTDSPAALMDRAHWPEALKQRAAELKMHEVRAFVQHAEIAPARDMFSETTWSRLRELQRELMNPNSSQWRDRVELFRDLEAAADEDPAGDRAQALVARWSLQLDRMTGHDPEVRQAMISGWSRRKNWPESQRWRVERLHMMTFERFERAADFLDRARAVAAVAQNTKTPGLKDRLLDEFEREMKATRPLLERLPKDKLNWQPHEKAFTLLKLANHVAALPGLAALILRRAGLRPAEASNVMELLAVFDRNVADCREQLALMSEERLAGNMFVNPGVQRPVWDVLRDRGLMNHLIHHRGQLSLYLRMLGVAVPGVYGPSADEK